MLRSITIDNDMLRYLATKINKEVDAEKGKLLIFYNVYNGTNKKRYNRNNSTNMNNQKSAVLNPVSSQKIYSTKRVMNK